MILFSSPGGKVDTVRGVDVSRPSETDVNRPSGTQAFLCALYPAINRWAILNCPSGTKKTRRKLLPEVYFSNCFLDFQPPVTRGGVCAPALLPAREQLVGHE